jgi:hypothetical protein
VTEKTIKQRLAAHNLPEDPMEAVVALADRLLPLDALKHPDELRTDGPTLAEFVAAGNEPASYPADGFAPVEDADYAAELDRRKAVAQSGG